MELKPYQRRVIKELKDYMELLEEMQDIEKAYNQFWNNKNVIPGMGKIKNYNNTLEGVPHICMKVPTGGGKTYLACNAIKPIFDSMQDKEIKMVVWLVPTDAIYQQTVQNLQNASHDYRIALDRDFSANINVLTKAEALSRKGFSASTIKEQVTVLVMSYDSFRSRKKSDLKVYDENGGNIDFVSEFTDKDKLIEGVDETALIQVINQCNPVVIVDESHHATSDLSVEMLKNLNPSFVLDLTATPKDNSNIISIVEAWELKKYNMVKLPVIVYNRKDKYQVLLDAIDLRNNLEKMAKKQVEDGGDYIRPIVLLQAETKGREENVTCEKLKKALLELDILEKEIAMKISGKDELKNVNLLSEDCDIRYIITINALKEGWDCPFAYILANIANRSSEIEVEQVVGRILRQPNTTEQKEKFLNMSYVLTSSQNFYGAVGNIIEGLNKAGFSDKYVKVEDNVETDTEEKVTYEQQKLPISGMTEPEMQEEKPAEVEENMDDADFDFDRLTEEKQGREKKNHELSESVTNILSGSSTKYDEFTSTLKDNEQDLSELETALENIDMGNLNTINEEYKESIEGLEIPCFYKKVSESIFSLFDEIFLTEEILLENFSLRHADTLIKFDAVEDQIVQIDIEKGKRPNYLKMSDSASKVFKQNFSQLPTEKKKEECKHFIKKSIEKINTVSHDELLAYVDKVVDSMTVDQIDAAESRLNQYMNLIKEKIRELEAVEKKKEFEVLEQQRNIICKPTFTFPSVITPIESTSNIGKSLYKEEYDNMDNLERDTIIRIASQENIKWWHRNPERKRTESFCLNGFLSHYPDFIVMTEKGNVLVIETKGSTYKESAKDRLQIGKSWDNRTEDKFFYYMLFDKEPIEGAMTVDDFIVNVLPTL